MTLTKQLSKPLLGSFALACLFIPTVCLAEDFSKTFKNIDGLMAEGKFQEALTLSQSLVEETAQKDSEGLIHANALSSKAYILANQENFAEAQNTYLKALNIFKAKLGEKDSQTVNCIISISELARRRGDNNTAEKYINEALQGLGDDAESKKKAALLLNNLSGIYLEGDNMQTALPVLEKAKNLQKDLYGQESKEYANSLNNLGGFYLIQGQAKEAEPLFNECMEIKEKIFGKESLEYALSANSLGFLYLQANDFQKAQQYLQAAYDLRKKLLPPNHSDIAKTASNLGYLYYKQEKYAEAEPYLREALQIKENLIGKDNPALIGILKQYSNTLRKQRKGDLADTVDDRIDLLEEALEKAKDKPKT